MNLRYILKGLAGLLLMLLCSAGLAADHSRLSVSPRRAEAPFTVAAFVGKYVHETEVPFDSYHYTSRAAIHGADGSTGIPPTGPLDLSDPTLRDYVRNQSAYFYKRLGVGLYLGVDPVYWRGIGGNDFFLVRAKIPKGARVLDLDSGFDHKGANDISPEARQAIRDHGCPIGDEDWESFFRADGSDVKHNPICNAIVYETLKALKIDLISYRKSTMRFKYCPERQQKMAFILVNPTLVPKSDIAYFYKEMDDPSLRHEQIQIERMFLDSVNSSSEQDPSQGRLWPELDDSARALPEHDRGTLLGC